MSLRVVVLGAENVGKSGKFCIKIDFYLILNLMENISTLHVHVCLMHDNSVMLSEKFLFCKP